LPGPPRVESSSTLKQIAAEIVDTPSAVEDVEGYALGQPEHGHLAVEAPETTPQMLQRVFGLEEEEELIEEMQCWLLRSDSKLRPLAQLTTVLQGYMYLTRRHICFFAKVGQTESDKTIKSGPLWKKASRTKLSTRYWVTLRNDVLSWYESPNVSRRARTKLTTGPVLPQRKRVAAVRADVRPRG
jgi:sterol 3beta-glucosyltransferase